MSDLRLLVEQLVGTLKKLPAGIWEIDTRGTGLILRKPNGRCCRPVRADMRPIVDVLNAARDLVPADDGSVR